ncbi:hypothetical protein C8R44DRAFT_792732 [Mycena epipterygia]|nr:hypothetical protein C8R44DRAFT_792732 [Mycena epipterygia]
MGGRLTTDQNTQGHVNPEALNAKGYPGAPSMPPQTACCKAPSNCVSYVLPNSLA